MNARLAAAAVVAALPAFAHATDLYSPSLPADPTQYLECRLLNVSGAPLDVTFTAYMSNGTLVTNTVQTLAAGESGGFSIPGFNAAMYCKFSFKAKAGDVRASIDIFEPTSGGGYKIFNALSAY